MMKNRDLWIPNPSLGTDFFRVCSEIISKEDLFKTFKRNPRFCNIIGNDVRSKSISDVLFDRLILSDSDIIYNIEKFKTNDLYGDPYMYHYPKIGSISPGTLYFIDILRQIINHFGNINRFNIVEIGSGYGGQAKIILDQGVNSYTCIDVKEPLFLCKKYLSLFNYDNVQYQEWNSIKSSEYNLVISNWCLSEFNEEGINYYVESVIKKCNFGFFLMNVWDTDERKKYIINKLKEIFNTVEILPEEPKTHQNNNFLLIGKK
jgi:putative sugar O-methyltransferase